MTTQARSLPLPRDRRGALALVSLVLAAGELVDTFFISFWEGALVFSVLFAIAALWMARGGLGGPILSGVLCAFELYSFPSWQRGGTADWASQITFAVLSAIGLLLAVTIVGHAMRGRQAGRSDGLAREG